VRKNAIQLLTQLLAHNPIGPELPLENFKRNFVTLKKSLEESTSHSWEILVEADTNSEIYQEVRHTPCCPTTGLTKLPICQFSAEDVKLLKQASYYNDGIHFLETLHKSIPLVCELLGSKNLGDVQEAIKFFVMAHSFKIDVATVRIIACLLACFPFLLI